MQAAKSGTRVKRSPYRRESLGQEVAELLAQAQANVAELAAYRDQEAFVIGIHGTQLRLVAAHFTSTFLAAVTAAFLPASEILRVRRSKAFEMELAADRIAPLKMLFGLFIYIRSGASEIGVCQALYEAMRQA
jgi:hypothetical protein